MNKQSVYRQEVQAIIFFEAYLSPVLHLYADEVSFSYYFQKMFRVGEVEIFHLPSAIVAKSSHVRKFISVSNQSIYTLHGERIRK